jgi:polyhydroxyalkanoate synthesis repressor PhaR
MTTAKRIIKKYPNRRLYDTEISSYVTLDDIKKLVLQQIPLQVIDARTQEDLTNSTLLQIITELEQQGIPIFTTAILQQIILFYGNSMQNMASRFLEQSLGLFMEQQKAMQQQMTGLMDQNPMNIFKDITAKQMQMWQALGENFRQGFASNKHEQEKSKHEHDKNKTPDPDIKQDKDDKPPK